MLFRFTLSHAQAGSLIISEPQGFEKCSIKLTRHEEYHSLIEYFEGEFVFYGDDGVDNGGIEFIRDVERIYGFDTDLNIRVEVAPDDRNYQVVFVGLLDLSELEELPDNKMQVPIIRNDFWVKFINRQDTPVDVNSDENEDGEQAEVIGNINLKLPNQKVRYEGNYEWTDSVTYPEEDFFFILQLDWEKTNIDDLRKFNLPRVAYDGSSPGAPGGYNDLLVGIFEAPYTGDFTFDIRIESARLFSGNWIAGGAFQVRRTTQFYASAENEFSYTDVTIGADEIRISTFNKTMRFLKGEQIAIIGTRNPSSDEITVFGNRRLTWQDVVVATTEPIVLSGLQTIDGEALSGGESVLVKDQVDKTQNGVYTVSAGAWSRAVSMDVPSEFNEAAVYVNTGDVNTNTAWRQDNVIENVDLDEVLFVFSELSDERIKAYPGGQVDNHLIVYADTIFRDTESPADLLHDIGGKITDRITAADNSFYSEFLGGIQTLYRQYESNGCSWAYSVLRGLQLRGYSLDDKPVSMSFKQWWEGANPILNLGLGYEEIEGDEVIRVENKRHFYDISETSVNINNVRDIVRKYDNERIFKAIRMGYKKWQSDDISGIDDPQAKHIYATRLQKSGRDITIESEFIAASLAIETTRRKTIEKSQDYKYDNDTFIIALRPYEVFTSPEESPDTIDYTPELSENFIDIENLENAETRYNIRLTPAYNLIRWREWLSAALQPYPTEKFKFKPGEGNYDMISTEINFSDGCSESVGELSEKQDIDISLDPFHLALLYEITCPLSWDEYVLIRDNRKKCIGISQTETDHFKFFVKDLDYKITEGEVKILAWPVELMPIDRIENFTSMLECDPVDECADAYLTEDSFEYETEAGECLILN